MKPKKADSYSLNFFLIFLVSFPLSVSISQISFIISFVFFLPTCLQHFRKFRKEKNQEKEAIFPLVFWFAFGIYLSIFLGSLIHGIGDFSIIINFLRGEVSDFWMSFAIPVGYFHYKNSENRRIMHRVLAISFGITVLTGLISIVTPYRLGKWISMGFTYPEGERLQHFAGEVAGRFTYLPIGLMNTHLTFGGILGMGFLGFVFYNIRKFWEMDLAWKIALLCSLLLSTLVVFYNQSRSIWIGCLFTVFIYTITSLAFRLQNFLHHKFTKSAKQNHVTSSNQNLSEIENIKSLEEDGKNAIGSSATSSNSIWNHKWIRILIGILFITSVGVMMNVAFSKNWLIQRALQDSLSQKTTENQRYFIWKNTIQVLKSNWILGVGNGNFQKVHNIQSNQMIKDNESLWYELYITPRGHAHHDFVHFFAVGGILTAVIWIGFWSLLWAYFYASVRNYTQSFAWGIFVLFAAGFFQCYQLDDEVVLPFYALIGIFIAGRQIFRPWHFVSGLLTTIIFLGMSLSYWIYQSSDEPNQIHTRKIIYEKPDNLKLKKNPGSIYLEGCLSHYYAEPIQNRELPMRIGIFVKSEHEHSAKKAKITLFDRDSFDQDKLYRAHKKTPIVSRNVILYPGDNWVEFPESVVSEKSEEFPGTVRFRDFEVIFDDGDTNQILDLPTVYLAPLC